MCPFCIGAATWAVAGVISAGGLGVVAAVVTGQRTADAADEADPRRADDVSLEKPRAD